MDGTQSLETLDPISRTWERISKTFTSQYSVEMTVVAGFARSIRAAVDILSFERSKQSGLKNQARGDRQRALEQGFALHGSQSS
jgi:hypothetical protein